VYGEGTHVTFTGVTLANCSIIVVAGAKLTLLECSSMSSEVALFASGAKTTVEMRGCELLACRQGVCAEAGATVSLLGLQCTQSTITGVEARGEKTKVRVRLCACVCARD
jgi:hypothetical protein